ncbi:MAG: septum formation initiator family protein [Candidatus Moranbacteria bacterium]|nr:septum formation initiator family protein [Candidatus Moranbacteria bacterium]OIQ03515.1 MAG: hypothetical protein AUK58_01870 [Candidatus Moranbacteria bacterium CG2_30_41_165]
MMKNGWWVKIIIGIVFLFSVWVILVSSQQIKRNYRIEEEVAKLQSEAETIRHENETLAEKITYFSSDNFREQEAKQKLGLRKSGENVVVIVPRPESAKTDNSELETHTSDVNGNEDNTPHYKKWWRLFF